MKQGDIIVKEQSSRKGEKIGWSVGWIGGYIWVLILAIVFIYQGKVLIGALGIIQTFIWIGCVFYFAPWRHPDKTYVVLMLPFYAIFFITALWVVWGFGGISTFNEFDWLNLLWIIPCLIPIPILHKKRWNDKV